MEKKNFMGRRKTAAKIMQRARVHRARTFNKLRVKLFKRAMEFSILCGAEVAIVAFSPSGRAYSFGYPSVTAVLDKFRGE
ncbi:Transcription factor, MADS-box [Dillenia turbinata]|uniref:Transcription factor, MADS-box n=1 Tax=Dillenia turbinata TaxID=194707 RepID=A0AAN8Z435_9MAGN